MPTTHNIFSQIPQHLPSELFQTLLANKQLKIERIVSKGQSSARDDWYNQTQDEWLIILEGQATLQFKNPYSFVDLKKGDYLLIPAHQKHRVHWTDPNHPTIWLAIHIYSSEHDNV